MINHHKKATKQAEQIKEEDRQQAIIDSLSKAANNQKKAAETLGTTMDEANKAFETLVNLAPDGQQGEALRVLSQANSLLNELKNGGDLNTIVAKIKAIK